MYLNKEGEGVKKIPLKQIPVGYFKKQSECLKSCDDLINMIAKKIPLTKQTVLNLWYI